MTVTMDVDMLEKSAERVKSVLSAVCIKANRERISCIIAISTVLSAAQLICFVNFYTLRCVKYKYKAE